MYMKLTIALVLLVFSLVSNASLFCGDIDSQKTVRGSWLNGSWGVRFVLPGGNRSKLVERFNSIEIINQLTDLKTPRWVMLNLTEPAFGSMFTSPNPKLNSEVSTLMTPTNDLLGYYIDLLRKDNYKIILYFASQGPSLDYLSGKIKKQASLKSRRPKFYQQITEIDKKWKNYLTRNGISNHQGTAEIIRYYSKKYGDKIDGWWFDHGKWGDSQSYIKAARSGNPVAAVAWNEKHKSGYAWPDSVSPYKKRKVWVLTSSAENSDFTDGHISLTKYNPPWWQGNELLVKQVESCNYISGIRPHIFIPLQSTWRGGDEMFPIDTAISWTKRVINTGGAITWAAALQPPEFMKSSIGKKPYRILQSIDKMMLNKNAPIRNSENSTGLNKQND